MTAFLISILANITTEAGKAILEKITGRKTIVKYVADAFDRALNNWTVNDDIRRKESVHIASRTTLLKQIVTEYESSKSIDKNIQELLNLFRLELMSDKVAYNLLIDNYFQNIIGRLTRLEGKIDNIDEIVVDFSKRFELRNLDTKEFVPISLIQNNTTIPKSFFINELENEPIYIPRTLVNYQNINEEKILFNEKSEENISLKELLSKESKIVLLGSAGTGKSIELKETAIEVARSDEYYPMFLTLNKYLPEDKIEDILPNEWNSVPENKIILFLDGLDEIEPSQFNHAKRRIAQYSQKYSKTKIVISCRTNFYELPSNNKVGTLRDFQPYFINELTLNDVKTYVIKFHSYDGEAFVKAVYDNNLEDLLYNPFFLKLILKNYEKHNEKLISSRVELFREFIDSRLELDESHFVETVNLNNEKYKALNLLRKISLSMEVIGTRTIDEQDLRKVVVETSDFNLVKYCTVFKKGEGVAAKWKFEHNYFQEFLCAELLSEQPFEIVKSFISYNEYEKVLPTWFNTVAQLISILDSKSDLLKEIIEWLIKNDSEVLVNVEREKLSLELRESIFIQIFDYYRHLKIWIDSNKFRDKDLAYFGQSEKCIKYIFNIAIDSDESRIVRLNALNVLGGFSFNNISDNTIIKNQLINVLMEQIEDSNFVFTAINTIRKCGYTDKKTVSKVFEITQDKKARYIRAAMYKFLIEAIDFENYIEYYIEGFRILKTKDEGRGETSLWDESWNLREGLKKFKTFNSLKLILEFCISENYLEREYDSDKVFKSIIANCIGIYVTEQEIFDYVFKLMHHFCRRWSNNVAKIVKDFFVKTKTEQKAFETTLELIKTKDENHSYYALLSSFINVNNFNQVIEQNLSNYISNNFTRRLYWDIRNEDIDLAELYKEAVHKQTDIKIELPEQIDWDEIWNKRAQASFNLLFDVEAFKEEALRVFGDKVSLTWDELWDITKTKSIPQEMEEVFVNSALDFVRDFARDSKIAHKKNIEEWFTNKNNVERYFIEEKYHRIKNNDSLEISEKQINEIKSWFEKYIGVIDFKRAVTKEDEKRFSINNYACYLTFFMKKFGFECKEVILLDMLLFAFGELIGMETIQFDYIIKSVSDIELVKARVVENIISQKIAHFSIYKAHVEFALINNLSQCYPTILQNLLIADDEEYDKNSIIDLFFKYKEGIMGLKDLCDELEFNVKIHLFDKLIQNDEASFVVAKLVAYSESDLDVNENRLVNNLLITTKQILGLKRSIDWIKSHKQNPFSQHGQGLSHFNDIKALPYLIELLELSYDSSITSEHSFDRLWSLVVNGLENLALASKENYSIVIARMKSFIVEKKGVLENVEFLNRPIEGIKEKYYSNENINYNIETALIKIQSLITT
ncbi:hypothetical protein [uncultured Draconibacterium sp.]|uniref:NACHT domain-containing protein n=1 Tax=uncultured Draconibacterium sp. TaxID=1573823 RepID=UPI0032172BB0